MPLPIIANTWQVRMNWTNTSAPRDASNNLYFLDTVGTQTATNLNTDFTAAAAQAMWGVVATPGLINHLTMTPLDGVTAGVQFATDLSSKWQGAGGTDAILQGCMVVTVKSTHRGPSGRGRIYLPWIAESTQLNGVITPANVASHQTAWNSFFSAMVAAGWQPCVVSPTLNVEYAATQYTCRPNLMTQRRRGRR